MRVLIVAMLAVGLMGLPPSLAESVPTPEFCKRLLTEIEYEKAGYDLSMRRSREDVFNAEQKRGLRKVALQQLEKIEKLAVIHASACKK